MKLQEIITKRLPITPNQESILIDFLCLGCRTYTTKEDIKNVIRYKFYSSFDGKDYSKNIKISDDSLEHSIKGDIKKQLKLIREDLIAN